MWMDVVSCNDCICSYIANDKKLQKLESSVKKKCKAIEQTWWEEEYQQILEEFFSEDGTNVNMSEYTKQNCPKFSQCLSILVKKLAWEEEYAKEKILPIISRWQVKHKVSGGQMDVIIPMKIVKKRVVGGVPSLSIEWKSLESDIPKTFETVESTEEIEQAYPVLYQDYMASIEKPAKKTETKKCRGKKAKKDENKENVGKTKPITEFFTQKKILTQQTEKKCEVSPMKLVSDSDEDNSVFDCSDLSFIIDDIVNKKESAKVSSFPPLFATSTPSANIKTKSRIPLPIQNVNDTSETKSGISEKVQSVFQHKKMENSVQDMTLEDSFDRMCL